jgi:hypothetical protein
MHSSTNNSAVDRPIVRPRWRGRFWIPIAALLIGGYIATYTWIREPRSNNPLPVRIGPLDREFLQFVFAPAVWCDIAMRDRLLGTAQNSVQAAIMQAGEEDKRAMLIFTSDHCLGCVQLDHFLKANESIVTKYFAIGHIHSSMSGYDEVERQYRNLTDSQPEYVPYIVIVDSAGNELANSGTKLAEPIAIPSGAAENRIAFLELLRSTASSMITPEDEATLRRAIDD